MESKINILAYAYDLMLLGESEHEIKMITLLLFKGLKINMEKTKYFVLTRHLNMNENI